MKVDKIPIMISSNQVNQVESSFVLSIRADDRDRGRLRRRSVTLKDGTSPKCQPEGCDYKTVVGLAAQDSGLHEREMHLRFHELTTGRVKSAVESLIATNCKFTSNKVTYFVQCWSVEQRTFECDPSLH